MVKNNRKRQYFLHTIPTYMQDYSSEYITNQNLDKLHFYSKAANTRVTFKHTLNLLNVKVTIQIGFEGRIP